MFLVVRSGLAVHQDWMQPVQSSAFSLKILVRYGIAVFSNGREIIVVEDLLTRQGFPLLGKHGTLRTYVKVLGLVRFLRFL